MLYEKEFTAFANGLMPPLSSMRYDEELKLRQDLAEMTRRWAIAEAEIIKLRGLLAQNGIEIK